MSVAKSMTGRGTTSGRADREPVNRLQPLGERMATQKRTSVAKATRSRKDPIGTSEARALFGCSGLRTSLG